MGMNRRLRGTLSGVVLSLILAACASGKLSSPERVKSTADEELPEELQIFSVKDLDVEPSPTPTPTPAPTPEADLGKRTRKRDRIAARPEFRIPNRRPARDPIGLDEKHVFEITYFGMPAGDFTMEVLPFKMINGRKAYDVRGTAVSSSMFSLFYRINDSVETLFDYEGLYSHRFRIVLDESLQTRDSLELNDPEKKRTFFWNRWNHKHKGYVETKDFFPIEPFAQDSLSALYYIRTLPLSKGTEYTFPIVSEGKTLEAVIVVVGNEVMSSPLGRISTLRIKLNTKYQGILQQQGDSFLWVTDDDRRFIVRLEAKVKIGSVVAALKKLEKGTIP